MEKPAKRVTAVLFDVDGVLRSIPFAFIHRAHMQAVRIMAPNHKLDRYFRIVTELRGTSAFVNKSRDFLEFLYHLALEGKNFTATLKNLHENRHNTQKLTEYLNRGREKNGKPCTLEEAYEHYRQLRDSSDGQQSIRTISAAVSGLKKLARKGVPVCLVTNAAGKPVREWAKTQGLENVPIVAKEDVEFQKSDPQCIHKALKKLGVRPSSRVYYIGDQPNDVQAAHQAGVTALSVTERGKWHLLAASGPHAIFRHAGQAVDFLTGKQVYLEKRGGTKISLTLLKDRPKPAKAAKSRQHK